MIQHLTNCHGEWNTVLAAIGSLPLVAVWLKLKMTAVLEKGDLHDC
jgi:hypothetical protein